MNFLYELLGLLNQYGSGWLHWGYGRVLVFTLVVTQVTIAGVTLYLHRSQAHRALDLHPVVAHFFRFWLWLTTAQNTKAWAAIHRKHHAKCETEEDPHSPQTRGIRAVLWMGAELYQAEAENVETLTRYGQGTPDDWIERKIYTPYKNVGIFLMLGIDVFLFGFLGLTVWAVQMAWIPFWAAGVINGLAHYWGYRNFDYPDASTNLYPWALWVGGEELHNNHHTYPTSAKFSTRWYEFDVGWMYIVILRTFGLAKVRRALPKPVFSEPSALDEVRLEAVLKFRYDVMAAYARKLRVNIKAEIKRLQASAQPADLEAVRQLYSVRKEVLRESAHLSQDLAERVSLALEASPTLALMYEMRDELAKLWQRSNVGHAQLLELLSAWCDRAERSGVEALQMMALRLRSYS